MLVTRSPGLKFSQNYDPRRERGKLIRIRRVRKGFVQDLDELDADAEDYGAIFISIGCDLDFDEHDYISIDVLHSSYHMNTSLVKIAYTVYCAEMFAVDSEIAHDVLRTNWRFA